MSCMRWRGSMPLKGSSSSSSDGSWTSADAIFTRWRMPLEYVEILRSCAYSISTVASARWAALAPQAVQLGVGDDEFAAGEEVVHRLALGDDADVLVDLLVAPDRLCRRG